MKLMKVRTIFACAVAVVALAGCNKNKGESNTAVAEDKVTITQATPPPGGNWSDVVNATSAGYMMGNPNAKVKLIEYGSLFCPYCKNFEETGAPQLVENYVKPGKVSWEFRPYVIHGPIDVAANIVARCAGTKAFFPLTKALYKDQSVLEEKFQAVPQSMV